MNDQPNPAGPKHDSVRFMLRGATRAEHDDTELSFGKFSIDKPGDYAAFLIAHAHALARIEPALGGKGWHGWVPRSSVLLADLADLGIRGIANTVPCATLTTEAEAWGVQYVLEGSRLGGQLLARQVPEGLPTNYLEEADSIGKWRDFAKALDEAAPTSHERRKRWLHNATSGARQAFSIFQQSADATERVAA